MLLKPHRTFTLFGDYILKTERIPLPNFGSICNGCKYYFNNGITSWCGADDMRDVQAYFCRPDVDISRRIKFKKYTYRPYDVKVVGEV